MTLPSWAPCCGDGCTDLAHFSVWIEGGSFRHHLHRHEEQLDLPKMQGLLRNACHEMLTGRRPGETGQQVNLDESVALVRFNVNERWGVSCDYGSLGREETTPMLELITAVLLSLGEG